MDNLDFWPSRSLRMANMLLRARAAPDAFGSKTDILKAIPGEPDFARVVQRLTPLHSVVDDACKDDPLDTDLGEVRAEEQEVVRLLLRYGAKPDSLGLVHYTLLPDGTRLYERQVVRSHTPLLHAMLAYEAIKEAWDSSDTPHCGRIFEQLHSAAEPLDVVSFLPLPQRVSRAARSTQLACAPDFRVPCSAPQDCCLS